MSTRKSGRSVSVRFSLLVRIATGLLALVALVACLDLEEDAGAGGSATAVVATKPPDTATVDLRSLLDEIASGVTARRGLSEWDVPSRLIDREELVARLETILADEYPPDEAALDQLEFELLGLLEAGDSLLDQQQAILGEQVIGYYDSEDEEMFVIGDASSPRAELIATLAHEYVHALQDRRFDLDALDKSVEDNQDAALAMAALVEGDATLAGVAYVTAVLGRAELEQLDQGSDQDNRAFLAAPRALQDIFIFPYVAGSAFVGSLLQGGGWKRVDDAYARLPASTEQVLHPEKYRTNELPLAVDLPDLTPALPPGWERVRENVMGEFFLKVVLEEVLDTERSAAAVGGWGGDAYALYRDARGRGLLAVLFRADTAGDEGEFWSALVDFLIAGGLGQGVSERSLRWAEWRGSSRFARAERLDGSVLLVVGHDLAAVRGVGGFMGGSL